MKTLEILTKIGERLAGITIANGYSTDLGEVVTYFEDIDSEYNKEGFNYRDVDNEFFALKNNYHEAVMPVEIDAILFGENVLELGCRATSDILRAIAIDPTWAGCAIDTVLKERFKSIETKGRKAIKVGVTIDIVYRFPKWFI